VSVTAGFGHGIEPRDAAEGCFKRLQDDGTLLATFWHVCTGEVLPW